MSYRCTFPAHSQECKAVTRAINQGIDSRLEGFTSSRYGWQGGRLVCEFAEGELSILVRRLADAEDDTSQGLADCIVYSCWGFGVV